ncbi:hypothetical protein [Bradyrhizobium sp. RDI18]|uniref:hypothetical protein n=1 Tax=Bradyrhizobium sp. RDI18 TaxID=3367400 RepID=UPI0037116C4C
MRSGVDQATTNVIARVNLVPSSVVMPYDGAVATLSGHNTNFLSVKDGLLVTAQGGVPAAIHQYDRNPTVRDFVYATYDGPKSGKAGDKSKDSTLQKKLRVAFGLQGTVVARFCDHSIAFSLPPRIATLTPHFSIGSAVDVQRSFVTVTT